MPEKTIELDIPLLLPGVEDEKDECLNRLESSFQNQKGILRAHLERDKSPVDLCLHYDPNLLTIDQVRRMAERAGAGIANRYHHALIPIEGMDCSDCVTVIEHGLERMDGVLAVSVNYATENMRIEYDRKKVDRPAIEKRVRSLGYEIPVEGLQSWYKENRELVFSLLAGLFVLIGWLGQTFFGLPVVVASTLYIAAYIFGGWDISQHAWHALKERHFDTDLLMVMAAIGAAFLGEFAEGSLLLFLFSLGHALEERALDRARRAVKALADLAPKTALTRRNGKESEVSVDELKLEDIVIVRPGVRIPVDGVIQEGQSAVDQSPVTGESTPVDKDPGDQVFAGSVNGQGALDVSVTRLSKDSTLSRVMQMVEEAQTQKSPTQQTTEKFTAWFVPAVLIGDLLLIIIPPLFGVPLRVSFLRAMTLLVAASPCALALGTPAAILAGIAQAARNGVLIKGGAHLENLGRLKAIALDKTGTVTKGKPELTDIVVSGSDVTENELLLLASAVENRSGHPLAQAVVRAAQSRGISIPTAEEVASITGRGIQANVNGKLVRVGNDELFSEVGIDIPQSLLTTMRELEASGKTTMIISLDETIIGLIAVADVLRAEAFSTLEQLKSLGIDRSIMLTGDNERTAAHISKLAGVSEARANLMPEDKLTIIRDLVKEHEMVAMVGDGVNDAPALANATVGIAMGGAGTDVALETADVALMSDDLSKLPFAVGLGRATRAIIQQNLAISLGVIALLIIASVTGFVGIGIAILFHEGSTLVVVANALRLLSYRPN